MKSSYFIKLALVAGAIGAAIALTGASNKTPLNRAFLQSNMDGNGFNITNLGNLEATGWVVTAGRLGVGGPANFGSNVAVGPFGIYYGNGAGLSNLPVSAVASITNTITNVVTSMTNVIVMATNYVGTLIGVTIDNGTNAIASGQKGGYVVAARQGSISGWSITAKGATPTCTFDVWKVAAGTALPTVANTIMGTKPALATGNAIVSSTVTTWSTNVSPGDILGVNLDAVTGASNITFQVFYR